MPRPSRDDPRTPDQRIQDSKVTKNIGGLWGRLAQNNTSVKAKVKKLAQAFKVFREKVCNDAWTSKWNIERILVILHEEFDRVIADNNLLYKRRPKGYTRKNKCLSVTAGESLVQVYTRYGMEKVQMKEREMEEQEMEEQEATMVAAGFLN